MIRSHRIFLFLAMLLAGSIAVHGWLRVPYEDSAVVERSELIVVGRLSRESIQRFEHQDETGAIWWEHHATLLVSEVLKGKLSSEEIPIVIHYGLTTGSPHGAGDKIGIFDSGNSGVSFNPLIEDVQADNLWFLRRRAGIYGREPGTGKYGVVDPEDVQPSRWRDYFLSYLAPDPETAVAEYARRNPESAGRAKRYLERLSATRDRWKVIGSLQIVGECEAALRELPELEGGS
jgi:hypothetical protein